MKTTLVVRAAGRGSRFGGLKQAAAITDDGRGILDFSCYDAKKAGFDDVVFILVRESKKNSRNGLETESAMQGRSLMLSKAGKTNRQKERNRLVLDKPSLIAKMPSRILSVSSIRMTTMESMPLSKSMIILLMRKTANTLGLLIV